MKRKSEFKVPVGTSYILVIVIVFALSVFGILSIKSSNGDLIAAKKERDSIMEYYKADSEAEQVLMQIGGILSNYYNDTSGVALKVQLQNVVGEKGQVEAKNDKIGTVRYEVCLNDNRRLKVKLNYNIETITTKPWDIVSWQLS